jgi:hypothetical protein
MDEDYFTVDYSRVDDLGGFRSLLFSFCTMSNTWLSECSWKREQAHRTMVY